MADEKVRIGFDGRPLAAPAELGPESDAYRDTTVYITKDGGRAAEGRNGRFYLVDAAGNLLRDRPIGEDQLA